MPIGVICQCGASFRAKEELAGKRVKCPACGQPLAIPHTTTPDSAPDPLGVNADGDDPLGLGQGPSDPLGMNRPIDDTLAGGHTPSGGPASKLQTVSPVTAAKPGRNRSAIGKPNGDVLVMVTAILCIVHGVGRIGSMYAIVALLASGLIFSFSGITSAASILVSAGILAAGIGLLTQQEWAKQVGSVAGVAHFVLLGVSVLGGLVSLAQLDNAALGAGVFMMMISSIVATSIVPALLLYVLNRDE